MHGSQAPTLLCYQLYSETSYSLNLTSGDSKKEENYNYNNN